MMKRTPAVIALSAALIGQACAGPDAGTDIPLVSTRDSAGIEIVDVARELWTDGDGWMISPGPVLDIGAMEGEEPYQLFRVSHALRLSDGSIVIANRGTQELRWFDTSGRHIRSAGGEGEGPGEFDSLMGLREESDTLFAHDFRLARITVFDNQGRLVRTVQLDREPGLPIEIWPLGDGFVGGIFNAFAEISEELTWGRRDMSYVRYAADGTALDTVDVLPGAEMIVRGGPVPGGFAMTSTTPLMGHDVQQSVVAGHLVTGITDRFEIRVYGPDGSLRRLIRDASRNRPVTGAEWDEVIAEAMEEADTPERRRSVNELAELRPAPETRPAFERFVPDRLGHLWVEPYRPAPGETVPWLVVDVSGSILGTVALPAGFRPTDIGSDYVLGVVRDELDIEHVRMYTLTRG